MPTCLRLFEQDMRAAASRTFWTAGRSRPIRIAMMAITTSSSISVNPDRSRRMTDLPFRRSVRRRAAAPQPPPGREQAGGGGDDKAARPRLRDRREGEIEIDLAGG